MYASTATSIIVLNCPFCRLKDIVPTTVNGSQQYSNTLDSRTPVYNPHFFHASSDQPPPSSQNSTLKKLTLNTTPTSVYDEPSNTNIQSVPLPIPIQSGYSYPAHVNNPQRDSGITLPQSDTFLLPPAGADPADDTVHIYAEPDEPGFNSQAHDYAELEACVDRYQNSTIMAPDQQHLADPQPYEVPTVVGGSYVNIGVPELWHIQQH